MPGMLESADHARLLKTLGQLESNFAGERDAAALAAVGFLRQRKRGWASVLVSSFAVPGGSDLPNDWRTPMECCIRSFAREREFIIGLRGFRRLSPKQAATLAGIAAKVRAEAGMA
jgi:hypothetical protein